MKGRRTGIWELGHSPRGTSGFFQEGGGEAEIGRKGERGEINRQHIGNQLFLNNKPSKQFSSSY